MQLAAWRDAVYAEFMRSIIERIHPVWSGPIHRFAIVCDETMNRWILSAGGHAYGGRYGSYAL